MPMTWEGWYRFRSYARSSLWLVPFIAILLALAATRVAHAIDKLLGWTMLGLLPAGAQTLLQTIVSAMLSFVVFTFGSLLVALQVASGQLTSRIIATTLLRDDVVRFTVGLFLFTLVFSLGALNRQSDTVSQLVVFTAAMLGLFCFTAFLYLIDYAVRSLRPISILTRVGEAGVSVIESVYPNIGQADAPQTSARDLGQLRRVIHHDRASQIVLAISVGLLMKEARRIDGIIECVPQVGDFVALDEPLFHIYGNASPVNTVLLKSAVAFGTERTMEQDPTFAFRIVVDIALRALSSAINDPTTSVLAIDQLHRMLRAVGRRDLRADENFDSDRQLRVILRTPNWDDFVHLACDEIRLCAATNLQVVRRLRAMIENLLGTLSANHQAALRQQLDLLDRGIDRHFINLEDLEQARVPDSQGLGGHSGRQKLNT
jgi:uncharacterized membrane protein